MRQKKNVVFITLNQNVITCSSEMTFLFHLSHFIGLLSNAYQQPNNYLSITFSVAPFWDGTATNEINHSNPISLKKHIALWKQNGLWTSIHKLTDVKTPTTIEHTIKKLKVLKTDC